MTLDSRVFESFKFDGLTIYRVIPIPYFFNWICLISVTKKKKGKIYLNSNFNIFIDVVTGLDRCGVTSIFLTGTWFRNPIGPLQLQQVPQQLLLVSHSVALSPSSFYGLISPLIVRIEPSIDDYKRPLEWGTPFIGVFLFNVVEPTLPIKSTMP